MYKSTPFIKHKLITILLISVFAGVGSYMVFQSKAAQYETNKTNDCSEDLRLNNLPCPAHTDWFWDKVTQIESKKVRIDIIVDMTIPMLAQAPSQLAFWVEHNAGWYTDATNQFTLEQNLPGYVACLNVERFRNGKNVVVASYTVNVPGDARNHISTQYDITMSVSGQGTCSNPDKKFYLAAPNSNVWGNDVVDGQGSAGSGGSRGGQGGTGQGTGGIGTASGTSGTGNSGAGGGGSSSGSSASKPSDQPNSIPISTPQGQKPDQPKIEPSPFMDGKVFGKASDAVDDINNSVGNITKTPIGRIIVSLIVFIIILGIAILVWWWRRRQLHSH